MWSARGLQTIGHSASPSPASSNPVQPPRPAPHLAPRARTPTSRLPALRVAPTVSHSSTAWAARPGSPVLDTGSDWPTHLAALALVAANQRESAVDRCHVRPRSLPGSSSSPTTANQKCSGRPLPRPQPSQVRLRIVGQEGGARFWSRSCGVQVLC